LIERSINIWTIDVATPIPPGTPRRIRRGDPTADRRGDLRAPRGAGDRRDQHEADRGPGRGELGTVYHHFPTYEEAVGACGARAAALFPVPTEEVLAGLEGAEARLRRLVGAWFGYYERLPLFAGLRHDRLKLPSVLGFVAEADASRRDLIGRALGRAGARATDLAMALTDPAVHASLRRDGWSSAEAAEAVARTILATLPGAAR
jgi:hypothetical protein